MIKNILLLFSLLLISCTSTESIEEKTYEKIYVNSETSYSSLSEIPYSQTSATDDVDIEINVVSIYEFSISAQDLGLEIEDPDLEIEIVLD